MPSPHTPQLTSQARASSRALFKRRCATFGLLFLLITQFGMLISENRNTPVVYHDFGQYYMGAVMARAGLWDSLYPIPNPDSIDNPGLVQGSTMRPAYKAQAD